MCALSLDVKVEPVSTVSRIRFGKDGLVKLLSLSVVWNGNVFVDPFQLDDVSFVLVTGDKFNISIVLVNISRLLPSVDVIMRGDEAWLSVDLGLDDDSARDTDVTSEPERSVVKVATSLVVCSVVTPKTVDEFVTEVG